RCTRRSLSPCPSLNLIHYIHNDFTFRISKMTASQPATVYAPMRIMGLQARTSLDQVHATLNDLWTRWQNDKAQCLPSFTLTTYCVYQYDDATPNEVLITIGRIVAQDLPTPPFAALTILPAQDYVRYEATATTPEAVFAQWQAIEQDPSIQRSFTTDFETYPINGNPKIYVGVQAALSE
ncbi:GyrI-like domain-containing protein, partial [Kingella kingae]|uniref:GyrI-like domain-containing protein n=2 Tax=Kingella kingae TaxID=504 RepID=UPI002550CCA3